MANSLGVEALNICVEIKYSHPQSSKRIKEVNVFLCRYLLVAFH